MRQRKAPFSRKTVMTDSGRAKDRVRHVVELAEKYQKDPDRKRRLEMQQCIPCYYTSRIGGAAMTHQECAACGSDELYGSTATEKLCLSCARKYEVCKCCGGDIKMRMNRKDWGSLA